jgi:hypothetical protein
MNAWQGSLAQNPYIVAKDGMRLAQRIKPADRVED